MAAGLTPEQEWMLIKTHGSLDNARDEAIERSDELRDIWTDWWPRTRGFYEVFWKRALPVLGVGTTAPAAAVPPSKRGRRKGAAGAPDAFYDREEIKRVLRLWRDRSTAPQKISQTSLARPGFSRTAVRRVIRLDEHGAFELGSRGRLRLLGIHGEFRAAPKKVSLRALERALGLEPLA
jgi:hypothetical protein